MSQRVGQVYRRVAFKTLNQTHHLGRYISLLGEKFLGKLFRLAVSSENDSEGSGQVLIAHVGMVPIEAVRQTGTIVPILN